MSGHPKGAVKIEWSSDFAYAIGLIASDGSLHKDGRHIHFSSKELELIEKFKAALNLRSKTTPHARGGESEKRYLYVSFSNKIFHEYLRTIGITPNKSKTIRSVAVPQRYFSDFLRGLFDGDGTFYSYRDIRWPNSFCFKTSIASASLPFLHWLKGALARFYEVKGYIHRGAGVYNLEYVKGDSRKLFAAMYYSPNLLFFSQKYHRMKDAFEEDKVRGILSLQKQRTPR